MKRLRKLLKLIIWFISVAGFVFIIGYFYLRGSWREAVTEEELSELVDEIKVADELPNRFYELYEERYKKALSKTLNEQIIKGVFGNFTKSPSLLVSSISKHSRVDGDSTRLSNKKIYALAWKIEQETSQRQCLNWVLKNYQFDIRFKGIEDIAYWYYNKNVHDLNDKELKGVIMLMDKPSLVFIPEKPVLGRYN